MTSSSGKIYWVEIVLVERCIPPKKKINHCYGWVKKNRQFLKDIIQFGKKVLFLTNGKHSSKN